MRHAASEITTEDSGLDQSIAAKAVGVSAARELAAPLESTRHNFLVIAVYQVLIRTGWIFKTESIIMPAVLDIIGGPGWLRGFLPTLNRFGQSVPPLLFSRRLRRTRRKKWALVGCTFGLCVSFLALASMWFVRGRAGAAWMPLVFLALYTTFFICHGLNQLALGTLQGKLVRTLWRGRLMLLANTVGAASAISCAWLLLPLWLRPTGGDFQWVFGFAAVCFGLAGLMAFGLRESADHDPASDISLTNHLSQLVACVRADREFQKVALTATAFGTSMFLFPHYQALGRQRLGLTLDQMVWWVIVQNFGVGVFSLVAGPLADRHGNRLVLRLAFLGLCISPLLAVFLALVGPTAQPWYWLVFLTVGLTPVTVRTLNNYTLELCSQPDHPRYLSTLSFCVSLPILFSPLVGFIIDLVGFEIVFLSVAAVLLAGWGLTLSLSDPRHHRAGRATVPVLSGEE